MNLNKPLIMDEQDEIELLKVQIRARSRADLRLKQLAAGLLSKLDDMTTSSAVRLGGKTHDEHGK